MRPRRGSAVFFRCTVGRWTVSLAEELHEGRGRPLRKRDTLSDEFRTHRVSREINNLA